MADINWDLLLALVFALIVFYFLIKILYLPFKMFFHLLLSAFCGGLLLVIFNFVSSGWGFQIGVNLVTAAVVGIMGIPGIIMLLILQRIAG